MMDVEEKQKVVVSAALSPLGFVIWKVGPEKFRVLRTMM